MSTDTITQVDPPAEATPDLNVSLGVALEEARLEVQDKEQEERPYGRFRSGLRHRVLNLAPSWFSTVMGTGVCSIILHNLPYRVAVLQDISIGIFAFNVVLFCVLLLASIARYSTWPKIFMIMLRHPVQSLFLGTFPMGLSTIINMIVFVCVPQFGQRFVTLAWVLWWIDVALSTVIGVGVPFVMFTKHDHSVQGLNGLWLLPIVANVVAAASGGVVASALPPEHARITIITSYILWGAGVPIAFLIMSLYFLRLTVHKVPPPESIVSVFLPVGPCGQGAWGILQLSAVARKLIVDDGVSILGSASSSAGSWSPADMRAVANAVYGVSVVIALIMWGLGLFWLVIAIMTVLDMTRKGGFPFNMGWWGFTFPLGVYAIATNTLGAELDSTPFKILGTVASGCVVLLWLVVVARTSYRAFTGTIFVSPCLGPYGGQPPRRLNASYQV